MKEVQIECSKTNIRLCRTIKAFDIFKLQTTIQSSKLPCMLFTNLFNIKKRYLSLTRLQNCMNVRKHSI